MPIGPKQVHERVLERQKKGAYRYLEGRERLAIHTRTEPLKAGTVLRIGRKEYKVDEDSYFVFIDLLHDANFAHPVVYELHSVKDGSVRVIEEQFPPADPEFERSLVPILLPDRGKGVR